MESHTASPAESGEMPERAKGAAVPAVLSGDQRRSLLVLGYLFLRMGQFHRARSLFGALAALDPADRWAQRNLAATALAQDDGKTALEHLRRAVGDRPLPTRDAALHLMRAQALWRMGRTDEARGAVDAYLAMGGKPTTDAGGHGAPQPAGGTHG